MGIIAFNKGRLRTATHITVMRNTLQYAEALADVNDQKLKALTTALRTAIDREDDDYQVSQGSKYTKQIEEADIKRDRAWGIIGNVTRAFAEGYGDEQHTAAALTILEVINKHKVNVNDQFVQQTGMVREFTQRADALAEEFAVLNLTKVYDALKDGNEEVNHYLMMRQNERADLAVGALKEDRNATDAAYANFVAYVDALSLVNPTAGVKKFIKEWNSYVNYVRVQIIKSGSSSAEDIDINPDDVPADGGNTTDTTTDNGGTPPANEDEDHVEW